MVPGLGLTILGVAGVGLSLAGIARTFIEGMHAISALMMFIGLIIFAAGLLKDGLPSSNTAKATVVIIIGFLVSFGAFMIGISTVSTLPLFAGVLLLITIPAMVIAYAAHKQSAHFKAIAILFAGSSVVGAIAFVSFGFVAPQPIQAGVLEEEPAPQELGIKVDVTILKGSFAEGAPAFDPPSLTVERGSVLVWTNIDEVAHTITSGTVEDTDFGSLFDSRSVGTNATFTLNTAKLEPGEYHYFCSFHPHMKGTFIVSETPEEQSAEGIEETSTPEVPEGTEEKSMAPNTATVKIVAGAADANNPEFFAPKEISVDIDTTVVWTNMDTAGHTVTSGNPGDADVGSLFDSNFPLLKTGETFEYTFDTAGEYAYFCQVHPWMVGKVIVK